MRRLNPAALLVALAALVLAMGAALTASAGPVAGDVPLVCNLDGDAYQDLAYKKSTTNRTNRVVDAASVAQNFTGNGGGAWDLQRCARMGSVALVSQGTTGLAANFVRVEPLNADGTKAAGEVFSPLGGGAWALVDTADVDGDGLQDLVFEGVDGTAGQPFGKVEIVVGANAGSTIYIQLANGLWDYAGKGDTDADGDEDLIWASNDGNFFRIDLSNGTSEPAKNVVSSGGFTIAAVGDVTGDDKADLVLNNTSTAKLQELDGATLMGSLFRPNGGGVLVPAFVAGTDATSGGAVLYINTDFPNLTRVDLMSNTALALQTQGFIDTGNFLPTVVGDFDGDGDDDIMGEAPGATRFIILDGVTATLGNFVQTEGGAFSLVN